MASIEQLPILLIADESQELPVPLKVPEGLLCESCRREAGSVLLMVRGASFRVCISCAADPDREVRS